MLIGERHATRYVMPDVLFRFFDGSIAVAPSSVFGGNVGAKTATGTWNTALAPYISGSKAIDVKDVVVYNSAITQVRTVGFYGSSLYSFASLYKFQDLKNSISVIGSSAFQHCSNLQKLQLHGVQTIGGYAFAQCVKLASVAMENLQTIGNYAFYGCTTLASVEFPACGTVGSNAFQSCAGLTTASFPAATRFERGAFTSCVALRSVYILGSSVVTLGDNKTFNGCGTNLAIYVPQSLYAQYNGSQFWKQQAQYIKSYTGG